MAESTLSPAAVKRTKRALTTTSYAILGLLSIKAWSAYELTQQMKRSLSFHWPRAESRVYMEAPNLVAHGLATMAEEHTGARRRTVYRISARGRDALQHWLAGTSAPPRFESEALTRSMFAENGTKDDLLRTLRELHAQATEARAGLLRQGVDYLTTGGPFPQRLHLIALNGKYLLAFTQLLAEWAQWAENKVATWPDTAELSADQSRTEIFKDVLGANSIREIEAFDQQARTAPPGTPVRGTDRPIRDRDEPVD